MPASRRIASIVLVGLAGALSAQAPKADAPQPRFSARQIAEAEGKLVQANCSLHHEELPPAVPNGPPGKGPVDIVAFPAGTTDADLAKLLPFAARLPGLHTIDLGQCKDVTAKGFKEVAKVGNLKALFLDGCTVDAGCLRELTALKQLQWLDLSRTTVGDADLKVLADFPALQNLTLEQVPNLTDKGVAHLQKVVRLRVLHISVENDPPGMMAQVGKVDMLVELRAHPVGDAEAKEIGNLTRLQVLDVSNGHGAWRAIRGKVAQVMPAVPDVPGLKGLKDAADAVKKLANKRGAVVGITPAGFPHLLKCKDLRVLRLAGHPVDVTGSGLDQLEFLRELDLSGTEFTDDGVSWLGRLKALRKLWLSGTGVTNDGVRGLAAAGGLELVALDFLPLTDEAVGHLARNRRLTDLSLNDTRVALADKKAWAGLGRLERLSVRQTNVTDSTLLNLAPLKTLKLVDAQMNCPNVTTGGAAALEKELPTGARVLAQPCQVTFWPGGGGVPVPKGTREPDLNYRNPNLLEQSKTPTGPPMAPPKAPPPPVRLAPLPGSGKP